MRKLYLLLLICFVQVLSASKLSTLYAQPAGTALSYDGIDDFLTFPSDIVLPLNGDYTLEQYVYWRGGAAFQRIFDFGRSTNEFMFLTPSDNLGLVLFAVVNGGVTQTIQSAAPLPLNTYIHIAVTVDGTNTGRLYINGQLSGTNAAMTLRPAALLSTDRNWLGRSQFPGDPFFNGIIEEFRISNSVRYTTNFAPPATQFAPDGNTLGLYHFNEGTGQTTADAGANSLNGILGQTIAVETSDPTWIMNSILPINLLNFSANKSGNAIILTWQANATQPGGSFVIERSDNGISFSSIAIVNANTGTHKYSYADAQPGGDKNYYRLKHSEAGAAAQFSKTVLVSMILNQQLFVFPNPVKGSSINFDLLKPYTGEVLVVITNAAGSVVLKQKIKAANRKEFKIERTTVIPAGNYLLQITGDGLKHTRQITCL